LENSGNSLRIQEQTWFICALKYMVGMLREKKDQT